MNLSELVNSVYMESGDQKKLISRFIEKLRIEFNYDKERKSNKQKPKIIFDLYNFNLKHQKDPSSNGAFFHVVNTYIINDLFRVDQIPSSLKGSSPIAWKEILKICRELKNGPQMIDEVLTLHKIDENIQSFYGVKKHVFESYNGVSFEIFKEEYTKDRNYLILINALDSIN